VRVWRKRGAPLLRRSFKLERRTCERQGGTWARGFWDIGAQGSMKGTLCREGTIELRGAQVGVRAHLWMSVHQAWREKALVALTSKGAHQGKGWHQGKQASKAKGGKSSSSRHKERGNSKASLRGAYCCIRFLCFISLL
jgi:hypothetical protein